jgi:TolA-binding protein
MFSQNSLRVLLGVCLLSGLSSCVDMSTLRGDLKAQVEAGAAKNAELQKAVNELNTQVKTLNEENNSVKSLISKVSDHVLAQQNKIEELETQLKTIQSQPKSFSTGGSKPKKR